jgi:hypothetical protein
MKERKKMPDSNNAKKADEPKASKAAPLEAVPPPEAWQARYDEDSAAGKLLRSLAGPGLPYRYAFSFSCDLDENTQSMQQLTGGVRKQITYMAPFNGESEWSDGRSRPNVFSLRELSEERRVRWNGKALDVHGAIASGSDWVVVDDMGVATFNARVTIKLAMNPDEVADFSKEADFLLLDATLKGTGDLVFAAVKKQYVDNENKNIAAEFGQRNKVFHEDYLKPRLGAGKLWVPVSLSVRFEGPSGPLARDSADQGWIPPKESARQAAYIQHYGALSRGQYFAAGHLLIDKNRAGWPAEKIEVHVCDIYLNDRSAGD